MVEKSVDRLKNNVIMVFIVIIRSKVNEKYRQDNGKNCGSV